MKVIALKSRDFSPSVSAVTALRLRPLKKCFHTATHFFGPVKAQASLCSSQNARSRTYRIGSPQVSVRNISSRMPVPDARLSHTLIPYQALFSY